MTHHQRFINATGFTLAFAILCLAFGTCVSGCTTARKVEKWNAKNPVKAAAYCAKTFPPVEWVEVIRDTLTDTTISFYPEWVFDTLYVGPDTVVMKAKCPPSKTITRTIRDTIKTRVRDSAAVYALQGQIQAQGKEIAVLSDNVKEAKEGRNWWMWAALITWGILAAIIAVYLLVKKLNPLSKFYPF